MEQMEISPAFPFFLFSKHPLNPYSDHSKGLPTGEVKEVSANFAREGTLVTNIEKEKPFFLGMSRND